MARRLRGQALNPVFHKQNKKEDDGQLSLGLIKQSRSSGSLNLSGKGLATGKPEHSTAVTLFTTSMHITSESYLETYCPILFCINSYRNFHCDVQKKIIHWTMWVSSR